MPIVSRKAHLSLEIIVIGGGISGLAAAYMLSSVGHRVTVLERVSLNTPGTGHRIPPNLSKILQHWVGEEELRRVSTRCVGTPLHRMLDSENVGYIPWKTAVMTETGGDFLLMHHEDLLSMLYKLAVDAGANVCPNCPAVSILLPGVDGNSRPAVVMEKSQILRADILIGADGSGSIVRNIISNQESKQTVRNSEPGRGLTVRIGSIAGELMRKDPELSKLMVQNEYPIWMGEHRSLCGHPMTCRDQYYIGLYTWDQTQKPSVTTENISPSFDVLNTEDNDIVVRKLLKSAQCLLSQEYSSSEDRVCQWVDSSGRILLLGDAAHPSLLGGSHTASMAVEDAVVLGCLLSHLRSIEWLPTLLNAYQELRQDRCKMVGLADIANTSLMCLPPGPEADARDEEARRQLKEWDEGMLKMQFDEIAEIFGYDAGDAAEEWWINWGRFQEQQFGVITGLPVMSSISVELEQE